MTGYDYRSPVNSLTHSSEIVVGLTSELSADPTALRPAPYRSIDQTYDEKKPHVAYRLHEDENTDLKAPRNERDELNTRLTPR